MRASVTEPVTFSGGLLNDLVLCKFGLPVGT